MSLSQKFLLCDKSFRVIDSVLDCYVSGAGNCIVCGVDIKGFALDSVSQEIRPHIRSECAFKIKRPLSPISWKKTFPKETSWTSPEAEDGDFMATIYVYEHAPITAGKISIFRGEGGLFLTLSGIAFIAGHDGVKRETKIEVHSGIRFDGVWLGRKSEVECQEITSRYFTMDDFKFHQTDDGVSVMKPLSSE